MRTKTITPPAAEPISVAEGKAYCGITIEDDDALVASLIVAARMLVETQTRRALVTRTLETHFPCFPRCGSIETPVAPVQSVESIQYLDPSGVLQTLDPTAWRPITEGDGPGEIIPAIGTTWPSTADAPDAVRVRYVAGYGDPSAVPECAKIVIYMRVSDGYINRESKITGTIVNELTSTELALLSPIDWGSYP